MWLGIIFVLLLILTTHIFIYINVNMYLPIYFYLCMDLFLSMPDRGTIGCLVVEPTRSDLLSRGNGSRQTRAARPGVSRVEEEGNDEDD